MSVSYSSFDNFFEPNWAFVERASFLEYDDIRGEYCALMCRYARKARENDDSYLYEDEDLFYAYEEGFLLDGMTQENWDEMTNPWKYCDPVFLGPYFIDQNEYGSFTFQGPRLHYPGPRTDWRWQPPGFTGEYYYDRTLQSDEECQPYFRV